MDLRKLKTLIDLVSESNIAELEITEAEGKVRIVKSGAAPMSHSQAAAGSAAAAPMGVAAPTAAIAELAAAPEAAPEKVVKSPMVGTFYRSASPGSKAFVEIGDPIQLGQAVCIIEAMKIMNEIESEIAGRVLRVLCESGQAVEFGQPLFVLE